MCYSSKRLIWYWVRSIIWTINTNPSILAVLRDDLSRSVIVWMIYWTIQTAWHNSDEYITQYRCMALLTSQHTLYRFRVYAAWMLRSWIQEYKPLLQCLWSISSLLTTICSRQEDIPQQELELLSYALYLFQYMYVLWNICLLLLFDCQG